MAHLPARGGDSRSFRPDLTAMDTEPLRAAERCVQVTPGVDLGYLLWQPPHGSTGAPVLLVHGLASNARLWDGVARRLARLGHPVVAVDQRGHGRSSKPESGFDFATLTGDLVEILRCLGWDLGPAPFAAGQSWGANVVLELACRHPGTVCGIGLVDGGVQDLAERFPDWPSCEAALAPPPLEGLDARRFEAMIRSAHPDWPEEGVAATLANVEVLQDGTVRPRLARQAHMEILHQLWEHRPSKRFADLELPVLIIPAQATGGPTADPRWARAKRDAVERAAAAARSVVRWVTGDHDLHAQHPALVAELIDAATRPGFFP